MSTQHTPGPWTVKKAGFQSGVITAPTRSLGIAEVFGGGEPDSANALLIAAAPDLLAALQLVYANAGESPEWIRARIGPAITKAEGRA